MADEDFHAEVDQVFAEKDAVFELPGWAVAGFAAGVINEHLTDEGCCPDCCAPCDALRWLRNNRREELDDAIVTHLGMSWDWQDVDRVDWAALDEKWGCQSVPTCRNGTCDTDLADAAPPLDTVTLVGGRTLRVHPPEKCVGEPCCVHSPTNHHMVTWEQLYRGDRGFMERICPHGIGHPDPDDLRVRTEPEAYGVHGCDGCCRGEQPRDLPEEPT